MQIALASGKGGTGKTTVSVNLALSAKRNRVDACLVDADVEEPNCHVFLRPSFSEERLVTVRVPVVDQQRCTLCGACADFCQFNALACMKHELLVFDELCHSCGGCWLICPTGAISERERAVGVVQSGTGREIPFIHGKLTIGEAMAPPVIEAARTAAAKTKRDVTIVDCPPGTSCSLLAATRDCDVVCLVTDPTPFGLWDLKLAVDAVQSMSIPIVVVVNRATKDMQDLRTFCASRALPILAEIPDDRRAAEAYAEGAVTADGLPLHRTLFDQLLQSLLEGRWQ